MGAFGYDVSHYQSEPKQMDWELLASDGWKFVIIKASEGTGWKDNQFPRNWPKSKSVGFVRGAYHYFRAGGSTYDVDPVDQAKEFKAYVDKYGGMENGDLIPWLDVEDDEPYHNANLNIPPDQVVEEVDICLRAIDDLFGVKCGIYTGAWFWNTLPAGNRFADRPLWAARYWTDKRPWPIPSHEIPAGWSSYDIHQYTSAGKSSGVYRTIDWNYAPGDIEHLIVRAPGGDPDPQDHIDAIRKHLNALEKLL